MPSRREVLELMRNSFGAAVWATSPSLQRVSDMLPPPKISFPEFAPFEEREPSVLSVFGMHDTPNVGGSIDIPTTIHDLSELGAKGLFSIDPSVELMDAVTSAGQHMSIRMIFPENRFNETQAKTEIKKYTDTLHGSFAIQPFNEVNNAAIETGGKPLFPEDHAADLLKITQVAPANVRILITPIDQHAPVILQPNGNGVIPLDEVTYYTHLLQALKQKATPEFLEQRMSIAYHMYTFTPGENPWERIQRLYALSEKILGVSLPIYITEAGLHQDLQTRFDDATIAEEIVRLLRTRIPKGLPVKEVDFWALANFAQRPAGDEEKVNERVKSFENDAWRKKSGPTEVFKAVANLSRK